MKVLGISSYFHDSGAAIVADGELIASAAEERFSYQKHDPNFPKLAIEFCLKKAALSAQELDAVIFYEEPHTKFTRVLSSSLAEFPVSRSHFVRSMRTWLTSKLWTRNEISKRLDLHPKKVRCVPHHLSHAAQAFFSSPFQESAILVVDSVGEWGSTSLYRATKKDGAKLTRIDSIPYPHSLGLLYSAFTAFLGFKVNDGECSTMALAAFGVPRYSDRVRRIIDIRTDGTFRVDSSYFEFDKMRTYPFSEKFIDLFGLPRNFKDPLPFDCLSGSEVSQSQQYFADVAASIQSVFEDAILALCKRLHRLSGLESLCYAGGGALNCVANSRIIRETGFRDVYIPADPGDGGAAVGAAFLGYTQIVGASQVKSVDHPYFGEEFDESIDIEMLEGINPRLWSKFSEIGASGEREFTLKVTRASAPIDVVDEVVSDLKSGKIIGWFQGRFENGPRALGNRSILADPSKISLARRLSKDVKSRASYRPYGLSLAEERFSELFEGTATRLSKWMQTTEIVKENVRTKVAGALHCDGSTRPQVCSRRDNPLFHGLLTRFSDETGIPGLLNTSFNESGFPIVASPIEAILIFARTDIDTLVLNRSIIRKVI